MQATRKPSTGSTIGREPRPWRVHRKWRDSLVYPAAGTMTGAELREARVTLGRMWGMGRPVSAREMAHVLLVDHRQYLTTENARDKPIPRHHAIIVTMCLDGARPRGLEAELVL